MPLEAVLDGLPIVTYNVILMVPGLTLTLLKCLKFVVFLLWQPTMPKKTTLLHFAKTYSPLYCLCLGSKPMATCARHKFWWDR